METRRGGATLQNSAVLRRVGPGASESNGPHDGRPRSPARARRSHAALGHPAAVPEGHDAPGARAPGGAHVARGARGDRHGNPPAPARPASRRPCTPVPLADRVAQPGDRAVLQLPPARQPTRGGALLSAAPARREHQAARDRTAPAGARPVPAGRADREGLPPREVRPQRAAHRRLRGTAAARGHPHAGELAGPLPAAARGRPRPRERARGALPEGAALSGPQGARAPAPRRRRRPPREGHPRLPRGPRAPVQAQARGRDLRLRARGPHGALRRERHALDARAPAAPREHHRQRREPALPDRARPHPDPGRHGVPRRSGGPSLPRARRQGIRGGARDHPRSRVRGRRSSRLRCPLEPADRRGVREGRDPDRGPHRGRQAQPDQVHAAAPGQEARARARRPRVPQDRQAQGHLRRLAARQARRRRPRALLVQGARHPHRAPVERWAEPAEHPGRDARRLHPARRLADGDDRLLADRAAPRRPLQPRPGDARRLPPRRRHPHPHRHRGLRRHGRSGGGQAAPQDRRT